MFLGMEVPMFIAEVLFVIWLICALIVVMSLFVDIF
jgi:hypothetical protein